MHRLVTLGPLIFPNRYTAVKIDKAHFFEIHFHNEYALINAKSGWLMLSFAVYIQD